MDSELFCFVPILLRILTKSTVSHKFLIASMYKKKIRSSTCYETRGMNKKNLFRIKSLIKEKKLFIVPF